jgi:uncharacterized membrane protein YphA (DoxX/SURF4 family)
VGIRLKFKDFVAPLQFVFIAILILRLFFAYQWLNSGFEKLQSIATASTTYFKQFENVFGKVWSEKNPYPFMVGFLKNVAASNVGIILTTVAISEFTIGLLYLLGLFVRPASIIGMGLNVIFFLAAGHTSPSNAGINLIMFGGQLFMFLVSAGRAYGLDALLHKRFPKIPLW